MLPTNIHPNTRLLLDAWQCMQSKDCAEGCEHLPAPGHPALINGLMMLELMDDRAWLIRMAGQDVCKRVGRPLANRNFTDLWTGPDRVMITAFLDAVRLGGSSGMIRARGETLSGLSVQIEITLIALNTIGSTAPRARILGLYQPLHEADDTQDQPIFRHRVSMLIPPDNSLPGPQLRLVASRAAGEINSVHAG